MPTKNPRARGNERFQHVEDELTTISVDARDIAHRHVCYMPQPGGLDHQLAKLETCVKNLRKWLEEN